MFTLIDIDGTLLDSKEGLVDSFRVGLRAIGVDGLPDSSLEVFLGTPLPEIVRSVMPGAGDLEIETMINAFRDYYGRVGMRNFKLYDGVKEMLESIKEAGSDIYIVTSKPTPQAREVIEIADLGKYVSAIFGAGPLELEKKEDLVRLAIAHSRCRDLSKFIMIGDRHYDVIGAVKNRIDVIGVLWGYGAHEELRDAGCKKFSRSPRELIDVFLPEIVSRSSRLWLNMHAAE